MLSEESSNHVSFWMIESTDIHFRVCSGLRGNSLGPWAGSHPKTADGLIIFHSSFCFKTGVVLLAVWRDLLWTNQLKWVRWEFQISQKFLKNTLSLHEWMCALKKTKHIRSYICLLWAAVGTATGSKRTFTGSMALSWYLHYVQHSFKVHFFLQDPKLLDWRMQCL